MDGLVKAMTTVPQAVETSPGKGKAAKEEKIEKKFTFSGQDYLEAVEAMEKYFLNHRMSDGFPMVPPTEAAVKRMMEGTDLPPDHAVSVLGPGNGTATVEKIAINAVMAGCLPQYMPVLIAITEAIGSPEFDLRGCQTTTGPCSPVVIVSGWKLIQDLNINYGFSSIGPGWRANSTIGRAMRLIMVNIGRSWPGVNDMKPAGMPIKFGIFFAENEPEYHGAWEPLNVAEGFNRDQPIVFVHVGSSIKTVQVGYTAEGTIRKYADEMRVGYGVYPWGYGPNVIVLSPTAFDLFREAGFSRADLQKELFEQSRVPCTVFARATSPETIQRELAKGPLVPRWVINACKTNPQALVPVVPKETDIKIIVSGGRSVDINMAMDSWGHASFAVAKPVKLPQGWSRLLEKYKGWETPIEIPKKARK